MYIGFSRKKKKKKRGGGGGVGGFLQILEQKIFSFQVLAFLFNLMMRCVHVWCNY